MKLMIWITVLSLSFLLLEVAQTSKQQGKKFARHRVFLFFFFFFSNFPPFLFALSNFAHEIGFFSLGDIKFLHQIS